MVICWWSSWGFSPVVSSQFLVSISLDPSKGTFRCREYYVSFSDCNAARFFHTVVALWNCGLLADILAGHAKFHSLRWVWCGTKANTNGQHHCCSTLCASVPPWSPHKHSRREQHAGKAPQIVTLLLRSWGFMGSQRDYVWSQLTWKWAINFH